MKRIALLIVVSLIAAAPLAQAQKMVISIGTFKNKSNGDNKLFSTLIDRMTNGIVNTRKFNVIDNARLNEALIEYHKVDSGRSSEKGAPKIGKIKSAGYVLYGTVMSLGVQADAAAIGGVVGKKFKATVELNVRFADVETGELVASKIVRCVKSHSDLRGGSHMTRGNRNAQTVQAAIQGATDQIVEKLMELAYPTVIIKVGASKVYVNLPEERAKHGAILNVFSVGEALTDPDTGESLGDAEEKVGTLKITRTSPKFCIATPVAPLTTAKLEKGMIVRPVTEAELEEPRIKAKKKAVKRFRRRF
jgi:curli biogenesis system outer membrane secretion channel CsgG